MVDLDPLTGVSLHGLAEFAGLVWLTAAVTIRKAADFRAALRSTIAHRIFLPCSLTADWLDSLDTNQYGRRILTHAKACELIAQGAQHGWYIAPFAMRWTIGRTAAGISGEEYHILDSDGEPITFGTIAQAKQYLRETLKVFTQPTINLRV